MGQTPDRVFFDPIKKTKQKKKKKTHYDHLIVYTLLGGSRETTFIHAMEESMCSPPPFPNFVMNVVDCWSGNHPYYGLVKLGY